MKQLRLLQRIIYILSTDFRIKKAVSVWLGDRFFCVFFHGKMNLQKQPFSEENFSFIERRIGGIRLLFLVFFLFGKETGKAERNQRFSPLKQSVQQGKT